MLTPTSTGCDPAIWVERLLRQHGMPPEEIRVILEAGDPEIVRRYLELHRERLHEQLDDRLRALYVLEAFLKTALDLDPCTSMPDPTPLG
jgi:DNA-binding transcriptional MerR regulator